MIISTIFFIHLIFSLVIFTIKWQEEKLSAAFLNVGLIAILFAVGWSITSVVAKFLMEPKGFGLHFDRDTFALTLLTVGEYFFYRLYYKPAKINQGGKEKQ
ncbi:MAG: hypothetical protein HXY50_14420 [Ignavibacteriaceae bacterium]|nr:hypothetical protein [Ignavibacteriaceae bacterium]